MVGPKSEFLSKTIEFLFHKSLTKQLQNYLHYVLSRHKRDAKHLCCVRAINTMSILFCSASVMSEVRHWHHRSITRLPVSVYVPPPAHPKSMCSILESHKSTKSNATLESCLESSNYATVLLILAQFMASQCLNAIIAM